MLIRRPPGHLHVKVFPGGHTGRRAQGRPSSAGGIIFYFLPSILGIPWVPPWIGIAREEDVWSAFVRLLKSNKSNIINEIFPDISLKIFCIWKSISKQKKHPLPSCARKIAFFLATSNKYHKRVFEQQARKKKKKRDGRTTEMKTTVLSVIEHHRRRQLKSATGN